MKCLLLRNLVLSLVISWVLIGCSQQKDQFQGYVEGNFTYISPNFSGVLESLNVKKGQLINPNTSLFVLEQEPQSAEFKAAQARLAQAQAQIEQTQANLELAKITFQRETDLFRNDASAKQNLDNARAAFLEAQATLVANEDNLKAAQADLEKARWTMSKKTVFSPIAGMVFDTFYYPGEFVQSGQPVLVLLGKNMIYAVFYMPEKKLGSLRVNQSVQIKCDGCSQPISARISYISPQVEYTPPVIYSNESNYKLVYRVEAYPDPAEGYKLHPGQPVEVKILPQESAATKNTSSSK